MRETTPFNGTETEEERQRYQKVTVVGREDVIENFLLRTCFFMAPFLRIVGVVEVGPGVVKFGTGLLDAGNNTFQ